LVHDDKIRYSPIPYKGDGVVIYWKDLSGFIQSELLHSPKLQDIDKISKIPYCHLVKVNTHPEEILILSPDDIVPDGQYILKQHSTQKHRSRWQLNVIEELEWRISFNFLDSFQHRGGFIDFLQTTTEPSNTTRKQYFEPTLHLDPALQAKIELCLRLSDIANKNHLTPGDFLKKMINLTDQCFICGESTYKNLFCDQHLDQTCVNLYQKVIDGENTLLQRVISPKEENVELVAVGKGDIMRIKEYSREDGKFTYLQKTWNQHPTTSNILLQRRMRKPGSSIAKIQEFLLGNVK